jgi:hypothetical protein
VAASVEGSCPGDAAEAAGLVLAIQEFVASAGGRPSGRRRQECCTTGADGQPRPCRSVWLVAVGSGSLVELEWLDEVVACSPDQTVSRGSGDRCDTVSESAMKIELLYFDGCPNYEILLPRLRGILEHDGVVMDIELVRVETEADAERARFLGSPTVRVDGRDVEAAAENRGDYGIKCRIYQTPEGLRGAPSDDWIHAAIRASRAT